MACTSRPAFPSASTTPWRSRQHLRPGVIDNVKRSGRVKGRAEVLFHFTTLIFPNGYTVSVPGSVNDVHGADVGHVINKEGSVQAEGTKGKDAGTIAGPAAEGAIVERSRGVAKER